MTRLRVMTIADGTIATGGQELLDRRPDAGAGWIWLDMQGVDAALEQDILMQRFGISRLAVQDAQRERHPPKFERFDGYVFLLLRELGEVGETDEPVFVHTSMFLLPNVIVTRHDGGSPSVDRVWTELETGTAGKTPDAAHVAYRICRAMVSSLPPTLAFTTRRPAAS